MKIRRANSNDIRTISKLFSVLDAGTPYYDKRYISKAMSSGKKYYIAFEKDTPVGAIMFNIYDKSCELIVITSSKKGTGKTLISFLEAMCKRKGVPKIWCWSLREYGVEGFYRKMGFQEIFLLKNQWLGKDCYFFGKSIR